MATTDPANTKSARLDINLALKLVKPFDGANTLLTAYIESVELLLDYAEGVSEKDIIKFLKTTLTGTAHGVIDPANTIKEAYSLLRTRFSVHLTPLAVEKELTALKQGTKSITEFGHEMEKMATKLAAAHVSSGNFTTEFAAHNIVNPIVVRAFIQGLNEANTRFFLQARNPLTLNKAISDALECEPIEDRSTALWYQAPQQPRYHNSYYPRQQFNQSYRTRTFQRHPNNQRDNNQQRHFVNNNSQRGNNSRNYTNNRSEHRSSSETYTSRNNNNTRVHLGNVDLNEECNEPETPPNEEHNEIVNLFR